MVAWAARTGVQLPPEAQAAPCVLYSDYFGCPVICFNQSLQQQSESTLALLLQLRELIETCGWSCLVVDLSNLEWRDQEGINGMLLVQSVLEKCRVRSVYCGLPPRVQQQLAICRLNRVLMIAAGPADAVRQLEGHL